MDAIADRSFNKKWFSIIILHNQIEKRFVFCLIRKSKSALYYNHKCIYLSSLALISTDQNSFWYMHDHLLAPIAAN